MKYTLGFIGCGNMGGALVQAAAKTLNGTQIAVCDHNQQKIDKYTSAFGVIDTTAQDIAKNAQFVILGMKPQVMQNAISEIIADLKANDDVTVVSMAAGLTIAKIRSFIGTDLPIIRIIPNTPVGLGAGMTLYSTADVTAEKENAFLAAFEKAGLFDKIPEEKIDAGSALSGCGPAFVYMFAEALADGAVECGLPRDKAAKYAAQTLLGAAEMLLEYGNPGALKDAVCSPGGTTIAGVHALENAGFRGATMSAVTSAFQRTLDLQKK